jgi:signal transduction histidine kinase
MLLATVNPRLATLIRVLGLAGIVWSIVSSTHPPATSGRGLVVAVTLAGSVAAWVVWTIRPTSERGITLDLWALAVLGGVLLGASPNGAASALPFVAVAAAGLRIEFARVLPLLAGAVLALAVSILVYNGTAVGLLAYSLGFAAAALAASNGRQNRVRAAQAELLLAQTQRSHEEQLRAARLEESARLAREIHDVLAHTLAGLTIQLEATASLLEQGADRGSILARVQRAHGLAREGLDETRRAVGALRGEHVSAAAGIEALVDDYRAGTEAEVELTIEGDRERLTGAAGQAVLRVVQEALTNVRKHAPGARVSVTVEAGDDVRVRVADRPSTGAPPSGPGALASTGGGYGLQGMRERAELLGGTVSAGPVADGWCVELRLPRGAQ